VSTQVKWSMMVLIASLGVVGCQGSGKTINLDLRAFPSASMKGEAYHEDGPYIFVEPFRDKRSQKGRIGSRSHFWGGATHFTVWDGNLSEGMADLALDYLQQRKWQAARSIPSEDGTEEIVRETRSGENAPADVILTGDILSMEANAKSGFGFTDIEVKIRVGFEAKNTIDGSTVRMVLGANGTDSVTMFNPKDVERLTNLVAKDLFNQLFQDLTVKNKAFRLKSDL
jgi:hypothetical protein